MPLPSLIVAAWDSAVHKGHADAVRKVLEEVPAAADRQQLAGLALPSTKTQRQTALHQAVLTSNAAVVRLLVQELRANVNVQNALGATPLMLACMSGDGDILHVVLDGGAKLDVVDKYGMSALHWAVYWGREAAVQLLVDAGCDTTIASTRTIWGFQPGTTCVDIARLQGMARVVALLATARAATVPAAASATPPAAPDDEFMVVTVTQSRIAHSTPSSAPVDVATRAEIDAILAAMVTKQQVSAAIAGNAEAEAVLVQRRYIESDPALLAYYDMMCRALTQTLVAASVVQSSMVENARENGVGVTGAALTGLRAAAPHIPVAGWVMSAVIATSSAAIAHYERYQTARLAHVVSGDPQDAAAEIARASRNLTLSLRDDIRNMMAEAQRKPVDTGWTAYLKNVFANVMDRVIFDPASIHPGFAVAVHLAAADAASLITALMGGDISRAQFLSAQPQELATILTTVRSDLLDSVRDKLCGPQARRLRPVSAPIAPTLPADTPGRYRSASARIAELEAKLAADQLARQQHAETVEEARRHHEAQLAEQARVIQTLSVKLAALPTSPPPHSSSSSGGQQFSPIPDTQRGAQDSARLERIERRMEYHDTAIQELNTNAVNSMRQPLLPLLEAGDPPPPRRQTCCTML